MNSQVYSALVMVLFFRNYDKEKVPSIKQLVEITDSLAEKLGISINISTQTKYNAIKKLVTSGILTSDAEFGYQMISISKKVRKYLDNNLQIIV